MRKMKARVYYWKTEFWQALMGVIPSREDFSRYYAKICEVESDDEVTPEDIFEMLNTNEGLKDLLQFKAAVIGHTSMSVGDIVEINGKYYICRDIGWEEIFREERPGANPGEAKNEINASKGEEKKVRG